MKTLFVIGYVWPEPNSSAAGARMLQLIQSFQQRDYQVIYGSPAAPSEHAIDYAQHKIETVNIELNNASFDDYIQGLNPDVVLFDRFMMEEQFGWRVEKYCPNTLRILDTEDLHCLRQARQSQAKGNDRIVLDVSLDSLLSDVAKREVASIFRCDLTLMISRAEMAILQNTFQVPQQQIYYLPFMVQSSSRIHQSFDNRHHFVSIGNFRHEPNWDAVLQLKNKVWPTIRKALPQAELHVFGAYPPKKATQLHNPKQGFWVKGWCEDALAELEKARVLLAPLRFGAGLKGKILDAAQAGLPSVTTSIGVEGLPRTTCEVSDDWDEFAEKAIELYSNPNQWQRLQSACDAFVQQEFDWSTHHPKFQDRIDTLLADPNAHRQPLFVSAMLRHHTLKSTQYMAQWIEAKNKLANH